MFCGISYICFSKSHWLLRSCRWTSCTGLQEEIATSDWYWHSVPLSFGRDFNKCIIFVFIKTTNISYDKNKNPWGKKWRIQTLWKLLVFNPLFYSIRNHLNHLKCLILPKKNMFLKAETKLLKICHPHTRFFQTPKSHLKGGQGPLYLMSIKYYIFGPLNLHLLIL